MRDGSHSFEPLEARDTFNEARRIARAIADSGARAKALGAIAEAAPAAGSSAMAIVDGAIASLNDAVRDRRFAEPPLRDQLLAEFALVLAKAKRGLTKPGMPPEIAALSKKTLRVEKDVANPLIRDGILKTIVEDLSASGQADRAMRVAQNIETPSERVGALVAVASPVPN